MMLISIYYFQKCNFGLLLCFSVYSIIIMRQSTEHSEVFPASAVDWTSKLISYDTTSRESNLELIGYIQDYLSGMGISCVLTHDETGRKANLFATIPSASGETTGGIVLSGHTDVVPVD